MYPTISAAIAEQHQHDLQATAQQSRLVRGTHRAHRARTLSVYRTWLAAGRL